MKILHTITSLRTGGAEKLMVDLLPRLRDLGNEVELLLFDGINTSFYEELKSKGIKIHSLGIEGNVYNPCYIFQLRSYFKQFDIVHTHNTAPQFFSALIGNRSWKLVTTEHNTTNRRRDYSFLKPIDKWMYHQYDHVICCSEKTEQNLKDYLPSIKTPISTINNGIDVESFQNAEPEEALRSLSCKKIVMAAAFRDQKDQKTLIQSLKFLPKDYQVFLVGDGELQTQCKEYVALVGMTDRVHFLGRRSDVKNLLHAADFIVLSSHYEGLSLSSLEGMSVGKPFISSDVPGLREIVGGYGILFPHEDEKALAEIILRLSNNQDFYQQVSEKCLERARQFDISTMAEKYNQIYKQFQ